MARVVVAVADSRNVTDLAPQSFEGEEAGRLGPANTSPSVTHSVKENTYPSKSEVPSQGAAGGGNWDTPDSATSATVSQALSLRGIPGWDSMTSNGVPKVGCRSLLLSLGVDFFDAPDLLEPALDGLLRGVDAEEEEGLGAGVEAVVAAVGAPEEDEGKEFVEEAVDTDGVGLVAVDMVGLGGGAEEAAALAVETVEVMDAEGTPAG